MPLAPGARLVAPAGVEHQFDLRERAAFIRAESRGKASVLAGFAVPVAVEQPGRLAHDFTLGAPPGVGEVAVWIPHHPLGTVVVILDGDVHRHAGCLSHVLSVASVPARAQWPAGYLALSG